MGKSLNENILKNYNGCSSFVTQKVSHDFDKIIILKHRYWNNLNLLNSFQKYKNLKTSKSPGLNPPPELTLTDQRPKKGTDGSPVSMSWPLCWRARKDPAFFCPRRVQRGNNREKIMYADFFLFCCKKICPKIRR